MMSFTEFEKAYKNVDDNIYLKEYSKLQDETEDYNKKCYRLCDGVRLINIINCDRIYWNASSICSILYDDLFNIDNRIGHIEIAKFSNFLNRIICSDNPFDCDTKIKEWFCRNYRNYHYSENNKKLNKMIRNNYSFYYKNNYEQLWR